MRAASPSEIIASRRVKPAPEGLAKLTPRCIKPVTRDGYGSEKIPQPLEFRDDLSR
jgi:hypothetical protein